METPQTGIINNLDLKANRIILMLNTSETMDANLDDFLTPVTINGVTGDCKTCSPVTP